jgi:hypothetical protein
VDAEQAGVGQLAPQGAVDGSLVAAPPLDLLEALVGGPLGEDPAGQFADGFLLFAVGEIHGVSSFCGLSAGPRHAEAEDGDEVALDLVGAAAEGQDDHGAGVHLEPPGDHGGR